MSAPSRSGGAREPRARTTRARRPGGAAGPRIAPEVFAGEVLRPSELAGRAFTGRRVAVLAPGREAAWILPEVARTAASVKVFQEGPDWLLPLPLPLPRVAVPVAGRLHLRLAVRDPWLRRRLTPDPRFNHHRARVDGRYYAALQQPHCTLFTWPIFAVVPEGVRTAEGIEHRVDVLVVGEESTLAPLLFPDPSATARAAGSREDLPA